MFMHAVCTINPLKTNGRLLYLKTSSYHAVNTFHLSYKNQSVHDVNDTSHCLFSYKYKTHKCIDIYIYIYIYSIQLLNVKHVSATRKW